jgi:hypothetical protein
VLRIDGLIRKEVLMDLSDFSHIAVPVDAHLDGVIAFHSGPGSKAGAGADVDNGAEN